jgi:hypothetical protein
MSFPCVRTTFVPVVEVTPDPGPDSVEITRMPWRAVCPRAKRQASISSFESEFYARSFAEVQRIGLSASKKEVPMSKPQSSADPASTNYLHDTADFTGKHDLSLRKQTSFFAQTVL